MYSALPQMVSRGPVSKEHLLCIFMFVGMGWETLNQNNKKVFVVVVFLLEDHCMKNQ